MFSKKRIRLLHRLTNQTKCVHGANYHLFEMFSEITLTKNHREIIAVFKHIITNFTFNLGTEKTIRLPATRSKRKQNKWRPLRWSSCTDLVVLIIPLKIVQMQFNDLSEMFCATWMVLMERENFRDIDGCFVVSDFDPCSAKSGNQYPPLG